MKDLLFPAPLRFLFFRKKESSQRKNSPAAFFIHLSLPHTVIAGLTAISSNIASLVASQLFIIMCFNHWLKDGYLIKE
jgi:hypothetical protein